MTASAADGGIAGLVAEQSAGHPLAQVFYSDPEIFRRDLDRMVLRRWLCAGHVSSVPNVGDFFLLEIAMESAIIVRGEDGELRALVNVCRHRGSRVCRERSGNTRVLICPYHAWTYGIDGKLRAARHMAEPFDKAQHGLKEIPLRVIEGLIFVTFADQPLGLSKVEEVLRRGYGPYGWADAKVAHREIYPIEANWKLAVENYVECYHCAPSHPEYARLHANEQPRAKIAELNAKMDERATALGLAIPNQDHWALAADAGEEAAYCVRYAMLRGAVTGSADGQAVAPLMGAFKGYDGGSTFIHVGPASFFLAYPDHGIIYRFMPRMVQRSELEVIWLVRGDAREGVDYDLDRLTWLWKVTSDADKRIIEDNQRGVNSRYYVPGPFSVMESQERRFVEWYLSEIG
ncbi:MAG TPA: aromatic ring-hydroxylating dioxygenase subunit alpha [Stellaceae bacterium]|jgi:Rieske 2Fe-2S family protein|nr:aromatic ring-hydroxylating dioxygenase subunit alpha [Stellaceae bacterium]